MIFTEEFYYLILVRAKCVRQRLALHTVVENVVASINTVIFSFLFLRPYFSPRRGCPRVVKIGVCTY